jgi:hypothetical protein
MVSRLGRPVEDQNSKSRQQVHALPEIAAPGAAHVESQFLALAW